MGGRINTDHIYSFQGIFALAAANLEATQKRQTCHEFPQCASPEYISVVHGLGASLLESGDIYMFPSK